MAPSVELVLVVSTRWPPLAPKKESDGARLSRKPLSAMDLLRRRFWALRYAA